MSTTMLAGLGIQDGDLPALQPVLQHRVWERFRPGEGPGRLAAVIGELSAEDGRFSMDGGSWTNNVSWMRGYGNMLAPMERASTLFSEHLLAPGVPAGGPRYRRAVPFAGLRNQLLPLLGQGTWTGYGAELARRAGQAASSAA